jgi:tetratricopeptide (TPR) repeat protein
MSKATGKTVRRFFLKAFQRKPDRRWEHFGSFVFIAAFSCLASLVPAAQPPPQQSTQQIYQEAQAAMARGEYDRAIQQYQRLLERNNKSPELHFHLGLANYQKGDYEQASIALGQAVELKPDFVVAKAFKGLSDSAMGRLDTSTPLLEEAYRSEHPDLQGELKRLAGIRLGKNYSDSGRTIDAELLFASLLEKYPNDTDLLYQTFWLHMTRARETMEALLKQAPNSYRTHEMLGHLLIQKDNYPAAVQQFQLALKANPTAVGLHYELGKALILASAPAEEIRRAFRTEIKLHPFHAGSHYQLAELAFSEDDLDSAFRLYNEALRFQPILADAKIGLCKISLSRNQLPAAETQCREAAKLDPLAPSAHYVLARVYMKMGRQEEAKEQLALFQKLKREADEKAAQLRDVQIIQDRKQIPELPQKPSP